MFQQLKRECHPYQNHPRAEAIETLGRRLYEELDFAFPGDTDVSWCQLDPATKGAYMSAICAVTNSAPSALLDLLSYNCEVTRRAEISK